MKRNLIISSVLLTALFALASFASFSTSAKTTGGQGSGCPYVCREEYKICVKRKGSKCRAKMSKCLRMCPK
ncbi:MAG TPA: hypothetical protein VK400_20340 [Pyrinomonadaceae bacterium]|nr:hypothetical protein [Pyrinomonadaceae bacterium]